MTDFWQDKRVVVTGGTGFVGSHLYQALKDSGCEPYVAHSCDYDLRRAADVRVMLDVAGKGSDIDFIFNLAANVGGIGYNQLHPYALFYDNIQIGVNLIHEAIQRGVKKFVQVGTVCAYPKFTPVPFDERNLWDGFPEETNAPYGLAKRLLLVQLQAARQEYGFNGIYILPTNLYGPRDTFDPARSHVIPALIKKFVEAKAQGLDEVEVWGSGDASRDFLYVKDAIDGLLLLAEKYDRPEPINLGSGQEVRIVYLVNLIKELVGYEGKIKWDISKPDGQPRRVLRIWKAKELGWRPGVSLRDGLKETIEWYSTKGAKCV